MVYRIEFYSIIRLVWFWLVGRRKIEIFTVANRLDLYNHDKRFKKIDRIQTVMVSFCYRYMKLESKLKNVNDLDKRRLQRKIWTQALIIIKMYIFTVAEIIDDLILAIRWIERERILSNQLDLFGDEYEWINNKYDLMSENGQYAGEAMLKVAYALQQMKIKLSPAEIRASMSISDVDWERHLKICKDKRINERDVMNVLLVSNVGAKELISQAFDTALQHTISNKKLRQKMKWNAETLFKELLAEN